MSSKVYVADINALSRLKEAILYYSDSSLKLLVHVGAYLRNVKNGFECLVQRLEVDLYEAQQELDLLEQAQYDAESSRMYDAFDDEDSYDCEELWNDDDDEYCCYSEEIESKEQLIRELQVKLAQAESAAQRVSESVDWYFEDISFLSPPGGDKLLEYVMTDHTHEACSKLEQILEVLQRYLEVRVNGSPLSPENENIVARLNKDARQVERVQVQETIHREQVSDSRWYRQQEARAVVCCHLCHRPIPICRCRSLNESR